MSLLNVICSFKVGWDYILPQNKEIQTLTVESLMQILMSEEQDTVLWQYTIGVLQKLSLWKTAQNIMIDL